jgi:hypothetical protein
LWYVFTQKEKSEWCCHIEKSRDRYHVIKTIGSSSDAIEIENLYQQGKKWLSAYLGERDVFAKHTAQWSSTNLKPCVSIDWL